MNFSDIKKLLDQKVSQYNCSRFIDDDPVQIPHLFTKKEDIEIAGFLSSLLAWGQRKTIIANARRLMDMMGNTPHSFVMNAGKKDIRQFGKFVHRTFNGNDCIFVISSLQNIYRNHGGLQNVFDTGYLKNDELKSAILHFRKIFFEPKHDAHVEKHISDISKNSAGKRINLFLRWMVRKDMLNVDFGIWKNIPASALFIPLDIHTGRAARALGILKRKQDDWKAVEELSAVLRRFSPEDPVQYDYALFCLSLYENNSLIEL